MRRVLTLLAGAFAIAIVSAAGTEPEAAARANDSDNSRYRGDTIWVTNRDQATMAVFNAETGDLVAPLIPVGTGAHDVVVSRRADKAYVMNELENTVSVLSASTRELVNTLGVGPRPHHAKLSRDGRTVYVGLFGGNRIATIDTGSDTVREYTSSLAIGPMAHAPRPSHTGQRIYVPHEVGDLVTTIDAASGIIEMSINPGAAPSEVLATENDARLYVSMRGEGRIREIDLRTGRLARHVDVGVQPESLILTRNERHLIISMRSAPARLLVIDTRDLAVVATIPIAGAGTMGDLAVGSPDRRFVYATFDSGATGQGGVARVNLETLSVDIWAYPGVGRPHGIAYSTAAIEED